MHEKVVTCDQKLNISRRRQAVTTARFFEQAGQTCDVGESFRES
jgi:hypothetical protein